MITRNDRGQCSVSVIVPCWRCSDVVARAVASVARQTLRPLEVILVDDASGDGTLAVLEQVAAAYASGWIRVLALPQNGGPGPARNAGWDVAKGDHVALLDADDAWHSRKLEIQMAWMAAHPDVDLCGHTSLVLRPGDSEPPIAAVANVCEVSVANILFSNPILTRTVVMRRDVSLRFGGRAIAEDLLFWLQAVHAEYRVVVLDPVLAFAYRPEFSPGGFSGDLWAHEVRELRAIAEARRKGILATKGWMFAAAWSLLKYARRAGISLWRQFAVWR